MNEVIASATRKFLIFKLENEEYGLDIQKVTTIIENKMNIARVPNTPDFLKGVINLRGEIIPVISLRKRFGMPEMEYTEESRIIVVNIEEIILGYIVDSIVEVVELNEDSIDNIKSYDNTLSMDYVLGAGKIGTRIVTLLNIDKLASLSDEKGL